MAEKLARIRPTWYNTLVESHNMMYDREQSTLSHLCDSTPHDLRQGVLFYQKPPIKKAAVVAAARAIHSEVSTVNDSDSTLYHDLRQVHTVLELEAWAEENGIGRNPLDLWQPIGFIYRLGDDLAYLSAGAGPLTHVEADELLEQIAAFYEFVAPDFFDDLQRRREEFASSRPALNNAPTKYVPKKQSGYVYLLRSIDLYKIGVTTRSVEDRIRELARVIPHDIFLVTSIQSDDIMQLESDLHQRYAHKRKSGEWFELDAYDVAEIEELGGVA